MEEANNLTVFAIKTITWFKHDIPALSKQQSSTVSFQYVILYYTVLNIYVFSTIT
jgi:hypothetical protein